MRPCLNGLKSPMPLSARRWKQFAESRYAHEREALEFLRDILPDRDPNFLYSNFEFIADDGSVNEIDALMVTQAGVFLIELKNRGGIVTGNRHLWDWDKDGHTITIDSPLTLINSKARKLAGLLSKQKAFRGERAPLDARRWDLPCPRRESAFAFLIQSGCGFVSASRGIRNPALFRPFSNANTLAMNQRGAHLSTSALPAALRKPLRKLVSAHLSACAGWVTTF